MMAHSSPYAFDVARGLSALLSCVSSYHLRTAPFVMSRSRIFPKTGTR